MGLPSGLTLPSLDRSKSQRVLAKLGYNACLCVYRATVWLSTAPFQPLTHWYQVTPVHVQNSLSLSGVECLCCMSVNCRFVVYCVIQSLLEVVRN